MSNPNNPAARRVELLTWQPGTARLDDDTMVLMNHSLADASEPTWPGYLSPDDGGWRAGEGEPMPAPAFWAHMPFGMACQPPEDQTAAENLKKVACELVGHAAAVGLVLTIEQVSVPPLARGRHQTVVSVREVR